MKQTKKLSRRHWEFLERNGIPKEVVESLRFCEEKPNVGYIFSLDGQQMVVRDKRLVKYGV